jgi:DNA primase
MERVIDDIEALVHESQSHAWDPEPAAWYESRGFTHSTVDRFGLGYLGEGWDYGPLGNYSQSIIFPYEDGLGRLRKVRFRPLRAGYDGPKVLDFKGAAPHLYAIRAADNPTVYVAEGEPDTMICWQLGFRAVGMPGAAIFREEWKYLFRPPHVERVVLVLDPDKSGIMAAKRVRAMIEEVCEDVRVVRLPKGLDVNDAFLKFGRETLEEALTV